MTERSQPPKQTHHSDLKNGLNLKVKVSDQLYLEDLCTSSYFIHVYPSCD